VIVLKESCLQICSSHSKRLQLLTYVQRLRAQRCRIIRSTTSVCTNSSTKYFGVYNWFANRVAFTETTEVGLHGYEICPFQRNSSFSFSVRKAIGKLRTTIWKKLPLLDFPDMSVRP
jgi:hypothetical protein